MTIGRSARERKGQCLSHAERKYAYGSIYTWGPINWRGQGVSNQQPVAGLGSASGEPWKKEEMVEDWPKATADGPIAMQIGNDVTSNQIK